MRHARWFAATVALACAACASAPGAAVPGYATGEPPPSVRSNPEARTVPGAAPTAGLTRSYPRGEVYAGALASLNPAVGGGLEFGQVFRRSRLATWSFEGRFAVQGLGNELRGSSSQETFSEVQGGLKASFRPLSRAHPVVRAGASWTRVGGPTHLFGHAGDFYGGYVGLGWEWDITDAFTTGPEVSALVATRQNTFELVAIPQLAWHFIVRF